MIGIMSPIDFLLPQNYMNLGGTRRGIFGRYTSNCLRDKRPLVDYFMASEGIKKAM
jgi:hypothetical protein